MNKDILFINPGDHKKVYQSLSKEFTAIDTPIWASLLADYLIRRGFSPAIYDINIEGWSEAKPKELLNKYNPNLIVIMVYGHQPSASTQTMPAASKIAKDLRAYDKDILIAMGGTHPSALPEKTLIEENIDFVIQGEGAYTIKKLIKWTKGKGSLRDIKGLWYKKEDSIASTDSAPLIMDLDNELGDYAWELLPHMNNYKAHNWHCFQYFNTSQVEDFADVRSPYVSLYTSLGCPYSCHFCCINAIFRKSGIRYWSVEKVVSWIDILVQKYKVRNIRFADELFIISPKRIELFCDLIIERNYDLNIWVYGRVAPIKKSLLKKMKKAGINWICLGIESANEKVRNNVSKNIRYDIKYVVQSIQAQDINIIGNYMFGLPDDNIETMNETLHLAMDLNCEFINFYSVMAYPGSPLFEQLAFNKKDLPESWLGYSQHSYDTKPLPTKYLTSADVLKFRDDAFIKYYSNESYLNKIESKFGGKVKNHIEKMLNIKIDRKILEAG